MCARRFSPVRISLHALAFAASPRHSDITNSGII
jgi:hypothetical protein